MYAPFLSDSLVELGDLGLAMEFVAVSASIIGMVAYAAFMKN